MQPWANGKPQCASVYASPETTERGTLDVTPWLSRFLACLPRKPAGYG